MWQLYQWLAQDMMEERQRDADRRRRVGRPAYGSRRRNPADRPVFGRSRRPLDR